MWQWLSRTGIMKRINKHGVESLTLFMVTNCYCVHFSEHSANAWVMATVFWTGYTQYQIDANMYVYSYSDLHSYDSKRNLYN